MRYPEFGKTLLKGQETIYGGLEYVQGVRCMDLVSICEAAIYQWWAKASARTVLCKITCSMWNAGVLRVISMANISKIVNHVPYTLIEPGRRVSTAPRSTYCHLL